MRLRNRTFHYRRRVPADLRHHFDGLHEFTKTCHSTKAGDARAVRAQYDRELELIMLALRVKVMTPELARQRVDELFDSKKFANSLAGPAYVSAEGAVRGKTCSEVVKLCRQMSEPNWSPKTIVEKKGVYGRITERFGRKLMSELSIADMLEWRDELLAEFSIVTVNKYLSNFSGICKFAIQHGYTVLNPVTGLLLKDNRIKSEIRKTFDLADIWLIFSRLQSVKQDLYQKNRPERYWIPLICMLSGLRVDECSQLDIVDIDIYNLSFKVCNSAKGDKKVKSKAGVRDVPIHSDLLRLGFLVYVKNLIEKGEQKLFPRLTRHPQNGYSHELVKWWSQWMREIIPDKLKTFHSFRHTVADCLKQHSVDGYLISEILGHSIDNISISRYGKMFNIELKRQALEKIDFGLVRKILDLKVKKIKGGKLLVVKHSLGTIEFFYEKNSMLDFDYLEAFSRPDSYGYTDLHDFFIDNFWGEKINYLLRHQVR